MFLIKLKTFSTKLSAYTISKNLILNPYPKGEGFQCGVIVDISNLNQTHL
jgi:hypothetical protein